MVENNQQVDVFCKDLLLKSRIKEEAARSGIVVRVLRSIEDYRAKQLSPSRLVILDANGYEDSFAEFAALANTEPSDVPPTSIACFVAHVDEEIIAKAKSAGITDISPRSAFFNSLGRRFTAFSANPA